MAKMGNYFRKAILYLLALTAIFTLSPFWIKRWSLPLRLTELVFTCFILAVYLFRTSFRLTIGFALSLNLVLFGRVLFKGPFYQIELAVLIFYLLCLGVVQALVEVVRD